MIQYLKIEGLNGNYAPLEFNFNNDLNLFTGLNGCGKTTILKILWFANSGNIANMLHEVIFDTIELRTNRYYVIFIKDKEKVIVKWKTEDERAERKDIIPLPNIDEPIWRRREYTGMNFLYEYCDSSIFFPTFRRIEGGFSMDDYRLRRTSFSLKDALSNLSNELSTPKHQFVASISTDDITTLVNREYSSIVREINDLQRRQFEEIRQRIKNKNEQNSNEILKEIESKIKKVEEDSGEKLMPFNVLSDLIKRIFCKKGIEMDAIVFDNGQNVISSDKLSAGEKQMLSFLCYNTFSKNKIIFIDEPELSLHPDWQRLLIPTLLRQNNNNQFFIATHSPFIYASYPDKEIILNNDKGE
ncbi:MAG: ATP-binding protein [Bacteroidales bacterium]|nr:ATP-binding protein [Bacteroidales bacterium]